MARYHFNFRSRWTSVTDRNGIDLPDVQSAREKALASIREDFANAALTGSVHPPYSIVITDASGREVATITRKDAFHS